MCWKQQFLVTFTGWFYSQGKFWRFFLFVVILKIIFCRTLPIKGAMALADFFNTGVDPE